MKMISALASTRAPALRTLEDPVISAHNAQVARFRVIESHAKVGRVHPPKIVNPVNFVPLRFS